MTQLLIIASTKLSRIGKSSISPYLNSMFLKPFLSLLNWAFLIILSQKSTPITFPGSPHKARAMKQSFPAPDPKSKTISPYFISEKAVGIPHPSPKSASF
jgi:hypothetical protein